MTEFLVQRSYSDKYNLIACAIGHHIYESRWLRDPKYLDQIIHTWYRGNDGGPMNKMNKFSSWNADAVLARYMVDADKDFMLDMKENLEAEYNAGSARTVCKTDYIGKEMYRMAWKNQLVADVRKSMPAPPLIAICMVMQKLFH